MVLYFVSVTTTLYGCLGGLYNMFRGKMAHALLCVLCGWGAIIVCTWATDNMNRVARERREAS